MDAKLLDVLVCPVCKGPLDFRKTRQELVCRPCRLAYAIKDGIPVMMEAEARVVSKKSSPAEMVAEPFRVVIPARMASVRLPGKPLADIAGKPMVVRVAEAASRSAATSVCVATDHPQVLEACRAAGLEAVMTRADHPAGTDRIAEVAVRLGWGDDEIVVNVQGDEPLVEPALINAVAAALAADAGAAISTAAHEIASAEDFFNPNVVKVVRAASGRALYFSRAPIPFARDAFARDTAALPPGLPALRHIGIYGYRVAFLKCNASLAASPLEQFESLEQLRALWHGHAITVSVCDAPQAGVDTPQDLERVRAVLEVLHAEGLLLRGGAFGLQFDPPVSWR